MHAEWSALRSRVTDNRRRLSHLLSWSGIQYRDQLREIAAELDQIETDFLHPQALAANDAEAWIGEAHRRLRQHVEPLLDQFEGLEIGSGVSGRKTPATGIRRRHHSVEQ